MASGKRPGFYRWVLLPHALEDRLEPEAIGSLAPLLDEGLSLLPALDFAVDGGPDQIGDRLAGELGGGFPACPLRRRRRPDAHRSWQTLGIHLVASARHGETRNPLSPRSYDMVAGPSAGFV
jgi:hypothetical protein